MLNRTLLESILRIARQGRMVSAHREEFSRIARVVIAQLRSLKQGAA